MRNPNDWVTVRLRRPLHRRLVAELHTAQRIIDRELPDLGDGVARPRVTMSDIIETLLLAFDAMKRIDPAALAYRSAGKALDHA